MEYTKPALTIEELADLLLQRGLIADRATLIDRLRVVSFYRLSGYLHPFRNDDDSLRPGTTLEMVWRRYTFDRRLRLIVLDAIERVEVALRAQMVQEHVRRHGPFGYTNPANLPKLNSDQYGRLLTRIDNEIDHSHEVFVRHFLTKYGDRHRYLPLWMASEIMSYGAMFMFFSGVEPGIKRVIAGTYGVPDEVLFSWLNVLNMVRNTCAHHGRLWNREFGIRPLLPNARKYPQWHEPVAIPNHRVFAVLTILKYLTKTIAPQSCWPKRLRVLIAEYDDIPRRSMGFPERWDASPLWQ